MRKVINDVSCGLIIKLDNGNYRFLKSFYYNADDLPGFVEDVSSQLDDLGIPHQIVDYGRKEVPSSPFKGNAYLEDTSHYWVEVLIKG